METAIALVVSYGAVLCIGIVLGVYIAQPKEGD